MHEQVVIARRGRAPWRRFGIGSVHRWNVVREPRAGGASVRRHSAKPEGFLDLVEAVAPGPYLELFARRQRLGWDTWGDEALEHVDVGARVAAPTLRTSLTSSPKSV